MLPEKEDEDTSWHDELSKLRDMLKRRELSWAAFKSAGKSGGVRGFSEKDAQLLVQFGYGHEAISEGMIYEPKLSAAEFDRLWFHRWRFERGGVDPKGTE